MKRTLTTLALALAVQAGFNTATTGSAVTEVAAADFTGKIKRVRVKKRKTGNAYRYDVTSTHDTAVPAAGMLLSFRNTDGSDNAAPVTVLAPAPAKTVVTTSALMGMYMHRTAQPVTVQITPLGAEGEAISQPITAVLSVSIDTPGVAEFEFNKGTGSLHITHENGSMALVECDFTFNTGDPSSLSAVRIDVLETGIDADAEVTLGIDALTAHWRGNVDITDGRYQISAAFVPDLFKPQGAVIQPSFTQRTAVGDAPLEGPITFTNLRQKNAPGKYSVSAWSVFDGVEPSPVTAVVRNIEGEVLANKAMTVKESLGIYEVGGQTFQGDPAGHIYLLTFQAYNAEGTLLGSSQIEAIIMPECGEAPTILKYTGEKNGLVDLHKMYGMLDADADCDGSLHASFSGSAVANIAHIELIWEEPFEGPEPDELEQTMTHTSTFVRSVVNFNGPDAAVSTPSFEIGLSTLGGEGQDEDGVNFWATAGISGFGKGTKKATNSINASQQNLGLQ